MIDRLLTLSETAEILKVSKETLRNWDRGGKLIALRSEGGHRKYLESTIYKYIGVETKYGKSLADNNVDCVAVYCRVSSHDQKKHGDMDRQKGRILQYCIDNKYNIGYILEEVSSGMNAKRPKLNKLYKLVENHKINKIIIEHKDRLTRFMFDVFKEFFTSHGVEIEVMNETLSKSFENELVEDMISLLCSFSGRIYGKRSAERRKTK
jgi:predicted site-specific integrase-resolvase